MSPSESAEIAFPVDICLKIVSSLQVVDVCSLGSCSRFWEEVCRTDSLWESLSRDRWPDAALDKEFSEYENQRHDLFQSFYPNMKGWRGFYEMKHKDRARKANLISEYLRKQESSSESINDGDYIKAIEDLQAMHFSSKDVQLLLFKPKFSVLVNLVALHYCIMQLHVSAESVMEVLRHYRIEERKVFLQWNKLRDRLGFLRCPDKLYFLYVSLGDLAKSESGVFLLLRRGVYCKRLQIQISAA